MSPDQVRALLLTEARKLEAKPWRSTGVGLWCRKHGVHKGHVSEFLNDKRLPTTAILDALGLEWRIMAKSDETSERLARRMGATFSRSRDTVTRALETPACICADPSGEHAPYCLAVD